MSVFLALLLLLILLAIGVPIPFSFLGSALVIVFFGEYDPQFLLPYGYSKLSSSVILAIPLFIIAGGLINRAHVGDKLVFLVELFIGRFKSGLGAISIVSCGIFGAITGSACATLSAIGTIMFLKLNAAGYPRGHSAAILASSSVLGMLIPPSSIMILYAWVGQVSVLACFLATVIPGMILAILLCFANAFLLRKKDILTTPSFKNMSANMRQQYVKRGISSLPALTMPFLVLGSIYGGLMTPTEAAAVSAIYVLPLGFAVYKSLTVKDIIEVLKESIMTTGSIMLMLFCIMILSRLFIMHELPSQLLDFLKSFSSNTIMLLLFINVFMIVIGMLMDDVSAVLLVTPMLVPIAVELGIDKIQFASIVAVNLGMGNVTPPTAPLLYLSSQLNEANISEVMAPTMFLIIFAWLPTLLLTSLIPQLSLWLPNMLL